MHVFSIEPAGLKVLWVLVPVAVVLALVFTLLAISASGAWSSQFEVSEAGLRIRGDFYGRFIPAETLRTDAARRVEVGAGSELRPRLRTWGTGLPGYLSGWFRLSNGERALVYVTDRQKAVYVPTTLGYAVLLSPDDPEGFLAAIRGAGR